MLIALSCLTVAPLPWREDGQCGDGVVAPDGTDPAQCNPWDPMASCCNGVSCQPVHEERSRCHCDDCVDYTARVPWRPDGRCGTTLKGGDGIAPATCHPMDSHNQTCCSEDGWCGSWPSHAHCHCKDCVNHYKLCTCMDIDKPCQDPSSGRCYPRTENVNTFTRSGPHLPKMPHDRNPADDPRIQMSAADVNRRFDKHKVGRRPKSIELQPDVDGRRCTFPTIDCKSHRSQNIALEKNNSSAAIRQGGPEPPQGLKNTNETQDGGSLEANHSNKNSTRLEKLPVRLVAGPKANEGRVEVFFHSIWGTICGKEWDWPAAHVACRALGFGGVDSLSTTAEYGRGQGRVWLSHVKCVGNEAGLEECGFYGLDRSTIPMGCGHERDAGIVCSRAYQPLPQVAFNSQKQQILDASLARRLYHFGRHQQQGDAQNEDCFTPPVDLASALDVLEDFVFQLEQDRPIIDPKDLARLSRLRLRLRRLAGKGADVEGICQIPISTPTSPSEPHGSAYHTNNRLDDDIAFTAAEVEAEAYGISSELASRIPHDMFEELKRMPRKQKSLQESKEEFEEQQRQENFDPLENDPVEKIIRERRDHYVPDHLRDLPLHEQAPHEILRKPPIQNLVNRRPPTWEESYKMRYEDTMEQIRLGLAPEGIERSLGPGPWDHDPAFWSQSSSNDPAVLLDHELDEDLTFD